MKVRLLLLALVLFLFSSCGNLWDDVTPNISKINWDGITNNVYYVDMLKYDHEFGLTPRYIKIILIPLPQSEQNYAEERTRIQSMYDF